MNEKKNYEVLYSEYQEKQGRKYITTFRNEDEATVYKNLCNALIAKKVNKCLWIRRITSEFDHRGFYTFYVYYDHGKGRSVYRVKA